MKSIDDEIKINNSKVNVCAICAYVTICLAIYFCHSNTIHSFCSNEILICSSQISVLLFCTFNKRKKQTSIWQKQFAHFAIHSPQPATLSFRLMNIVIQATKQKANISSNVDDVKNQKRNILGTNFHQIFFYLFFSRALRIYSLLDLSIVE